MKPAESGVRVTMFADAFGQVPKDCDLAAVLEAIRCGRYEPQIRRARELFAAWKAVCPAMDSKASPEAKAYDNFKKTLPAFTVSGTAKSRKEPLAHSGLLQVDFDHCNGTLEAVRAKVKDDPHVAFGFVSPSGDGLKLGLAIDGTRHAESFAAAQEYFRDRYGLEIDEKVKDRLRLCFVSDDPQAWTKEAAPLPLPEPSAAEAGEPTGPELDAAESAAPSILVLPSGSVSISESARALFRRIAPSRTLFWRGGALVELVDVDGTASLDVVKPDGFRSRVEKFGNLFAWRSDGEGGAGLKRAKMSLDDAKAIASTTEAREFLPPIASVLRCPVIVENSAGEIQILGRGYHA